MPTDNVPADEFFSHGGLTIYYIYKNDDVNQPVRDYWFSLWPYGSDGDGHTDNGVFEIRQLPGAVSSQLRTDEEKKQVIRDAIDAGYFDDWDYPGDPADGHLYGTIRQKRLAEEAAAAAEPAVLVPPLTWRRLGQSIAAMTVKELDQRVRFQEPYDDRQMLDANVLNFDEDGPYLAD